MFALSGCSSTYYFLKLWFYSFVLDLTDHCFLSTAAILSAYLMLEAAALTLQPRLRNRTNGEQSTYSASSIPATYYLTRLSSAGLPELLFSLQIDFFD